MDISLVIFLATALLVIQFPVAEAPMEESRCSDKVPILPSLLRS